MRMGIHKDTLADSLRQADEILLYQPPGLDWNLADVVDNLQGKARLFDSIESIIETVCNSAKSGDQVLIMSNGGFNGLHKKLLNALK